MCKTRRSKVKFRNTCSHYFVPTKYRRFRDVLWKIKNGSTSNISRRKARSTTRWFIGENQTTYGNTFSCFILWWLIQSFDVVSASWLSCSKFSSQYLCCCHFPSKKALLALLDHYRMMQHRRPRVVWPGATSWYWKNKDLLAKPRWSGNYDWWMCWCLIFVFSVGRGMGRWLHAGIGRQFLNHCRGSDRLPADCLTGNKTWPNDGVCDGLSTFWTLSYYLTWLALTTAI